jgi:hypothetical protein
MIPGMTLVSSAYKSDHHVFLTESFDKAVIFNSLKACAAERGAGSQPGGVWLAKQVKPV